MSSYDDYAIENSGDREPLILIGLDDNGQPFETEYDRLPYDDVPAGLYQQEITRFQKFFQMARNAEFMVPNEQTGKTPDPMQTKTRLELLILDGPHAGKLYYPMYTVATGETATLGQLLRAITQERIPPRWNPLTMIGMRFTSYVQIAKYKRGDKAGQVKIGKEGHPFPEPAIGTVEPLNTEPVPESMQPAKKVTSVPVDDPRISWSAFWRWAERYGFNAGDQDAITKAIKQDFSALDLPEAYDVLAAVVTRPSHG